MTPWEDGLLFGKVEKLEGLPGGAAAPLYAEGRNRVNVFTHTFVGSADLRPHQIVLRDQLTHFVSSNRKVIEHLKLTWKIAADCDDPFTQEIMKVFRFDRPTSTELSKALSEIEAIVDSEDWRTEAVFSARSQSRHQADAVARRSALPTD
jgi:hypothetical protein